MMLNVRDNRVQSHVQVSTLAGAFSGGLVAASTRGRRNVVPGTIMFGLFGFTGQHLYQIVDASRLTSTEVDTPKSSSPGQNLWYRVAGHKWAPVKFLNHEQHERILKEKMLAIDAEIAMIDEDMQELGIKEKKE